MGLSAEQVAKNLCIDSSTVYRIVRQFDSTGTVSKKAYSATNRPTKMTASIQLVLLHLVMSRPGIYLWEIREELKSQYGLDVSISTIYNCLKKNFTRKKMQLIALQRDESARNTFVREVALYKAYFIIFVDETGCDRRNALRKYGYSVRGKPPRCQKLLVRGQRISVIAAMTVRGILDLKIVRETVKGEDFVSFTEKQLLPHLMNFDGHNSNSVVILDNCSVHHVTGVADAIDSVGALVHYLPAYSPDYNPIELLFSKVKLKIKEMEVEYNEMDTETIVLAAFSTVTPDDCEAWVKSCGIFEY